MTIANLWFHIEVGANIQLPYNMLFGGAKFDRGWEQLSHSSLMLLRAVLLLSYYTNPSHDDPIA